MILWIEAHKRRQAMQDNRLARLRRFHATAGLRLLALSLGVILMLAWGWGWSIAGTTRPGPLAAPFTAPRGGLK